jgi:hypothetical protein
MKSLDFQPKKSTSKFRSNYKLHDLAEDAGKNLLVQFGFDFKPFGEDRRFERVWEKGEDKPDIIIDYNGKKLLLDWKGKHKAKWIVNKRAIISYEKWSSELNLPIMIAFFVFNSENKLTDRRFAVLNLHQYKESQSREWDKNKTVRFTDSLPVFNGANIITFFTNNYSNLIIK